MDPLTVATSFSTLVGLIVNFASESRGRQSAQFEDFVGWLLEHQHQTVVRLLEQNVVTATSVKALLNHNHEELLERLREIDNLVARVAGATPGFRTIVQSINSEALISDQALSLLEQISDSGASKVLESRRLGGVILRCWDGRGDLLECSEPRFLNDDLDTLVELGFLRLDHNRRGERLFLYTRLAELLIKTTRAMREPSQ
jgi:hypothetical protein